MKPNQHVLIFTWLASIILPVGFVGFGLYVDRHHPPDADEWLSVVLVMGLMFAGVWVFYFFVTWMTGKRLPNGSKLSRRQVVLRKVVIAALIAAAICGLLLWGFYAMIGHAWSEAIH